MSGWVFRRELHFIVFVLQTFWTIWYDSVRAKLVISIFYLHSQISSHYKVEPLVQSEKLVERAYVRPYTPYVHPRPQVVTIIILMILIIVVLFYFILLIPYVNLIHHHMFTG